MPKTILLLRHGEEPKDPKSLDLSAAGRERAEKLASFIPKYFGRPDFIFAAAPTDASVRSYLTVRPLADSIDGCIDGSYKAREFGLLASKLLADPPLLWANRSWLAGRTANSPRLQTRST